MSAFRHVVYRSRVRGVATPERVDALLADARDFNARVGVTGVLLLGGGHFFQCFEGTGYATDEVYERIRASGFHHDIVELRSGSAPQREFDRWYMGFCEAPASFLQALEDMNWQQTLYGKRVAGESSPALDRLFEFLEHTQGLDHTGDARMVA